MPPSRAHNDGPAPTALPTTFLTSMAFRLGTVGLNAITGIVTARALSPSGRGELAAMVLWPMLFAGLTTCGLPSALVYHMRRDEAAAPALIGWALALCTVASLVGTAIGWSLIPVWLSHHPPEVIRAAQWCLLTTLLCSLTLTARAAWEARGHFVESAMSQLVTPLFVVLGLALLAWGGGLTPAAAAAVYVVSGLPSLFWILSSLATVGRPTLDRDAAPWRRLTHYGFRSYGVDLCGILAIYLDQALVVGLLSASSMGIYAVALSLSRVIGAVHTTVATMVFPRVVGLAPEAMIAAVGRSGADGHHRVECRRARGARRRPGPHRLALRRGLCAGRLHPADPRGRGDRRRARPGAAARLPGGRAAGRRHDGARPRPGRERAAVPLAGAGVRGAGGVDCPLRRLAAPRAADGGGLSIGAAAAGAAAVDRRPTISSTWRATARRWPVRGRACALREASNDRPPVAPSRRLHRPPVGAAHRSPAARRRVGLVLLRAPAGRTRTRRARSRAAGRHP